MAAADRIDAGALPRSGSPTREDVLAVAESLLEHEGAAGLSMRKLAAALGTSYQVVYSRVGGKPDVVRALHAEGFRRLRDTSRIQAEPGSDERLIQMGHAYLDTAVAHPALFDVMFGSPVVEFHRDAATEAVEWAGFEATWVTACHEWLDARLGPRRRREAVRLAWRLWSAVHGITVLHLAGHRTPEGDVKAEMADVLRRLLRDPT
ncbi:TetR/AcrR family transcriptional regulator [Euzebya tangerina]|uniref:TetR/AcrR family transcriptional regulator n=1 Tax=Euzebya tangerina TaxID=591198 RepID=UPI0013C3279B|nr:TetR-like C-terminal domain-containing protein [Euzebya tangerina]